MSEADPPSAHPQGAPPEPPVAPSAPPPPSSARLPLWRRALIGRDPRRTLVRAAVVGGLTWAVLSWVVFPVRAVGSSMEPLVSDRSFLWINLLAYRSSAPARGDVVAIRLTSSNRYMYLKRIIALPGERIEIRSGQVRVDGRPLDEPYVVHREPWNLAEVRLGPGEYYVIGDNRGQPITHHRMGRVDATRIAGRAIL